MRRYTLYSVREDFTYKLHGSSRLTKRELIENLKVADWSEALELILVKGLSLTVCTPTLNFDNHTEEKPL